MKLLWRFSDKIDRTMRNKGNEEIHTQKANKEIEFLRENPICEKPQGGGENSLFSRTYSEFSAIILYLQSLRSVPLFHGGSSV